MRERQRAGVEFDLGDVVRNRFKHSSLLLTGDLRMQGKNPVAVTPWRKATVKI